MESSPALYDFFSIEMTNKHDTHNSIQITSDSQTKVDITY